MFHEAPPQKILAARSVALCALLLLSALLLPGPVQGRGVTGLSSSSGSPGSLALLAPSLPGAPPLAQGYSRVGPEPKADHVATVLALTPGNLPGLEQYAREGTRVPPLTPAQVMSRFGPAPSAVNALTQYLHSAGLQIRAPTDGWDWEVTGSAGAFEAAFHTQLTRYSGAAGGSSQVVFTAPPTLPAGLPVSALASPSDTSLFSPVGLQAQIPSSPPSPSSGGAAVCPTGGLTPAVVQGAYNVTPVIAGGSRGQGVTIGIVDAYDSAEPQPTILSDLQSFSSCFGLPSPAITFSYPVPGGNMNSSTSSGWGLEIALDTQWSHASAPDASIDLVLSPNSGYGLYYGVASLVAQDQVGVISLSWGESELGIYNGGPCSFQCNATTDGSFALLGPPLAAAAAEGIDVFVASGDCGANGGTPLYSPWFPASDPFAIGVGGTQLNVTGDQYRSENGWSGTQTTCNNQGGSGGGFSVLPRPPWQTGPGFSRFPGQTTRGVPDVSLVAGTALGMIFQGNDAYVEGTSDAAPQWAGYAALLASAKGTSHPGFLAPGLYAVLNSSAYPVAFHPILSGWNGYTAGYGWNPVTGIGTPNFSVLLSDLLAQTLPTATPPQGMVLKAAPGAGPAPLTVTFTASPENFSLYQYAFGDVGPPYDEFNATTTPQDTIAHTYGLPGTYTAYAVGYSSTGTGVTNAVVLNVGNAGPLTVNLTATPADPTAGEPVTFTATASGGTGPYAFGFLFGDGSSQLGWGAGGPQTVHTYPQNGSYRVSVVANDSSTPQRGGVATLCLRVGNVAQSCPSDLPTLVTDLAPQETTLASGASIGVNVTVTYNGLPVVANVTASASQGRFLAPTGTTNASGQLSLRYVAPTLSTSTFVHLYANASGSGFSTGLGRSALVVNPVSGPSLTGAVTVLGSPLLSGTGQGVVVRQSVLLTGLPARGVTAFLNTTVGSLKEATLAMPQQPVSVASDLLTLPLVTTLLPGSLTLELTAPGFTPFAEQLNFTVVPAPGSTPLVAELTLPSLVPSLGRVPVQVSVFQGPGMSLPLSPAGLSFGARLSGVPVVLALNQTAPGSYAGDLSAPATLVSQLYTLSLNLTAPGYSSASVAAVLNVTGATGALALRIVAPGSWTPGETLTLEILVSSANLPGSRLGGAALSVKLSGGTPDSAELSSDVEGVANLTYTAPNARETVMVTVLASAYPYESNRTSANFSVSQPSLASLLPELFVYVILPVGTILAVVVAFLLLRKPAPKHPPVWVPPWQPPPSAPGPPPVG